MKALVYTGPNEMDVRDVPEPVPAPGEHLIKVEAVGICGSDMHGYHGHDDRRPAPLILGHEAAGVIIGGPKDGTRVTVNPLVVPNDCAYVQAGREHLSPERQIISMPPRDGAFAQYLKMPDENLVEVPDHVAIDHAALTEPLAVSWHAVKLGLSALHSSMDKRALVIGGGAIGLASALALRAMGVTDVTIAEPNDGRRAFLQDTCNESAVEQAEGSFSLVIDAVGYAVTREVACARAAPGGVIVHVGLGSADGGVDVRRLTLQEISFIGSYCYTKQDFRDTAEAIFDGRMGDLTWFASRHLDDGWAAFRDIDAGRVPQPKTILKPWG